MPFTEPVKATDPIETVKKIARLATLLLELRNDFERHQSNMVLEQIRQRAAQLHALADELPVPMPAEKAEDAAKKQ